jgi:hypothetical protein
MSHPLYRFGKAYQDDLLRTNKLRLLREHNLDVSKGELWQRITTLIGNGLISVGEKVKGDHEGHGCPEFSQGRV